MKWICRAALSVFRLRKARPALYLTLAGTVLALSKVHAGWRADPPYDYTDSSRLWWSCLLVVTMCGAAYACGIPDARPRPLERWTASIAAAGASAVMISAFQLVTGNALLPRFVVFGAATVSVPINVIFTRLAASGRRETSRWDRVLLVAGCPESLEMRNECLEAGERPATLVATVEVHGAIHDADSNPSLVETTERVNANVLVLDRAATADPHVVTQAAVLHARGVRVRSVTTFYDEWLAKLPSWELERASLLFDISEIHASSYVRVKRLVDLTLAVALLPVVGVVCAVAAAANRVTRDRGPLFYSQLRVGKSSEPFRILKLRTMVADAGAESTWTVESDPRITRIGRLLRRSHLDELPQVLNVLRGELSFVGPRPEQCRYVDELREKLPFYDVRHLVRPGVTGWAQVKYRYAAAEADALEKLQYEFWYLNHQSLTTDIRILGRTVRAVLRRSGR